MESSTQIPAGTQRQSSIGQTSVYGKLFHHIELTGARYPPEVIERVRELAAAVSDDVESLRIQVKARTEVKFVKL